MKTLIHQARLFAALPIRRWTCLVLAGVVVTGCGRKPPGGPGGPGGPPEVGVIVIAPASVTLTQDLPGRASALRVAEVRARVSGIVRKRFFKEGGDVREGDVLYQIDPAPYEAALRNSQGTLARAEANAASTNAQEERSRKLLEARAISKQEHDNSLASFPPGVYVVYPYDTTPFVRLSVHEVVKTLPEAVVLVFLVMYLFLQNWRATIIPTIAVPVVLLGTFGVMTVAGFSINTLTLFRAGARHRAAGR